MPSKITRCREKNYENEELTDKEIERRINAVNRRRAEYYEYCTGQKWGNPINYDLCINTTQTSIKHVTKVVSRLFTPRPEEKKE